MTKKQQRMADIVNRLKEYVDAYDQQANYVDYSDTIFIDDLIYCLGLAIDPEKYYAAPGYDAFKDYLIKYLSEDFKKQQQVTVE